MSRVLSFEEDVMSLVVDSKNDVIIAGYESGYLNVWDARCSDNPILRGRFLEKDDVSSAVIADSDASVFYVASGKSIYRVDSRKVSESTWASAVFECLDDINQIVVSENKQLLGSADDNNDVSVFDIQKSLLVSRWNRHKNCVSCVRFNPGKARQLISGGYDCALVQWDVLKGRTLSSVNVSNLDDPEWKLPKAFNPAYVLSCDVTPSRGNACVVGTENGNLHLFRCEKQLNHARTFRAHDRGITQAKFFAANKGELIVSGGNDMKIKTWKCDQLSESPLEPLTTIHHHSKINWLTFHNAAFVVSDTSPNISIIPAN